MSKRFSVKIILVVESQRDYQRDDSPITEHWYIYIHDGNILSNDDW